MMGYDSLEFRGVGELAEHAARIGQAPRFHGNGFVQLYLDNERRLHVFHPGLLPTRVENARTHDHRWDMASTVLLGRVGHITYDALPDPEGGWEVVVAPGASDKTVPLKATGSRCQLHKTGEHWMAAGSRYFFKRRQFHESAADELTMTVIRKTSDDGRPARIVSPHGTVPDHAFLTQPPLEELWAAIGEAMRAWRLRGRYRI